MNDQSDRWYFPTDHDSECQKAREKHEEYFERWPNPCRRCGATGGWMTGGSYYQPPDFNECSCLANGICPRCGKDSLFSDEDVCRHCGWDISNPDPEAPGPYECSCEWVV